MKAVFLSIEDS